VLEVVLEMEKIVEGVIEVPLWAAGTAGWWGVAVGCRSARRVGCGPA
jgi:hypothetical protein